MRRAELILATLLSFPAFGQVMPSPDITVDRPSLPPETGLARDTEYKRRFQEAQSEIDKLRRDAEDAKAKLKTGIPAEALVPVGTPATPGAHGASRKVQPALCRPRSSQAPLRAALVTSSPEGVSQTAQAALVSPFVSFATPVLSFATSAASDPLVTVLPTGSHVKAKVVSGVEANANEPFPVLLQLDYAFTGPNQSRIDLSHCFMIAKARANLSTERVMMETDSLSCVRDSGEHFKAEAKAFVAGADSTFGATGTFISKQGQVLLAAVLANIAKNAGSAVAEAQQSQVVVGADKGAVATNLTGSKAAFVAGKSLVDAGSMIADWYLQQARQLVPSIGIGSGQDVFVIMLDTVRVPTLRESQTYPTFNEVN